MKISFCFCIVTFVSEQLRNDVMFTDVCQHGGDVCVRTFLQRHITIKHSCLRLNSFSQFNKYNNYGEIAECM